jgi:hypothetical protein
MERKSGMTEIDYHHEKDDETFSGCSRIDAVQNQKKVLKASHSRRNIEQRPKRSILEWDARLESRGSSITVSWICQRYHALMTGARVRRSKDRTGRRLAR